MSIQLNHSLEVLHNDNINLLNYCNMKKIIMLTLCLATLAVLNTSAKIWRVNNTGLPADFTTIQAAHDATTVLAGDTLNIEPSSVPYGNLTSTKKLIIIGPGYFLNENSGQQANPATATIGRLILNSGSGGSVITGLTITTIGNAHEINTGNITVSRNNFNSSTIYLSGSSSYSDVIISGNYGIYQVSLSSSSGSLITNVFILNNYLRNVNFNTQVSGVIANNIFSHQNNAANGFTIKNNICPNTDGSIVFSGSSNTISNNIGAGGVAFPAGNGNQNNVNMTTVFVGATGNSTDGQWQLKTGSPAIGAGLSGEDCGIFGGNTPYHLSGLPATPSIYLLSAPAASNGPTLPVTISVKTNK